MTSALGFLRIELERFPNVAAVLGVLLGERDVCSSEEIVIDRYKRRKRVSEKVSDH